MASNAQNQITTVDGSTLQYDPEGNLTTDQNGNTYVYNDWHQLVQVNLAGGGYEQYAYDALGNRVTEYNSNTDITTHLFYNNRGQVIEEQQVAYVSMVQYVWSPFYVNQLIERDDQQDGCGGLTRRLYVEQDANYNVTSLTNSSGNIVERYKYDTYGSVTVMNNSAGVLGSGFASSAYGWQYGFQGGRTDPATGLVHFGARDYDPSLGRWIEQDPTGAAYVNGPNLYQAELSDPIGSLDPTGLGKVNANYPWPDIVNEELQYFRDNHWTLAADMLDHFLNGNGQDYTLTADDIADIKREGTITDLINDDILQNHSDGYSGEVHGSIGTRFNYWDDSSLFYGFGSIQATYRGTACVHRGGVNFKGTVTFKKSYNFDLIHFWHWVGYFLSPSWDAAHNLQRDGKAKAFNLSPTSFEWDFDRQIPATQPSTQPSTQPFPYDADWAKDANGNKARYDPIP